jgi:nitrogen regulatory protein P-II 1
MKTIIAFIQPFKEEAVREALHTTLGVTGASFTDIRGFGRGRGNTSKSSRDEALLGTLPKVRVELMVPESQAGAVVTVIAKAAKTGNRGDGKVYVLPVESALRISTGEEGPPAI